MKRLQPAVWAVLILAVNSVQAQTNSQQYLSSDATVYTDIVGEFEPSDDWIVQPDKEPSAFSQASVASQTPKVSPGLENVEIFGKRPAREIFS